MQLEIVLFSCHFHSFTSLNLPREADELEQQMEKDTAMLESLQIEKREKMNKKKEAEIKLEKEKRRLEKLDSKIRLLEKGDLNDDQSESRTYSEVDWPMISGLRILNWSIVWQWNWSYKWLSYNKKYIQTDFFGGCNGPILSSFSVWVTTHSVFVKSWTDEHNNSFFDIFQFAFPISSKSCFCTNLKFSIRTWQNYE